MGGLVACGPQQPPAPTPIPEEIPADWYDPEPSPPAVSVSACPAACAKLLKHGCPEGQPTPKGATCEERCRTYEASGLVTFHPRCVALVKSTLTDAQVCKAAKACEKQRSK